MAPDVGIVLLYSSYSYSQEQCQLFGCLYVSSRFAAAATQQIQSQFKVHRVLCSPQCTVSVIESLEESTPSLVYSFGLIPGNASYFNLTRYISTCTCTNDGRVRERSCDIIAMKWQPFSSSSFSLKCPRQPTIRVPCLRNRHV